MIAFLELSESRCRSAVHITLSVCVSVSLSLSLSLSLSVCLSLSFCFYLRFNRHFPSGPGLAGTSMSPFWILLELRMMEVVVTTGAIRRAKLQSNRHHKETNTQLFAGQMPFLSPNQQCQRTVGKVNILWMKYLSGAGHSM